MSFEDRIVVYWSHDDDAWVAHSLNTDQIGIADGEAQAVVQCVRAIDLALESVKEDKNVVLTRAPNKIFEAIERGTVLDYKQEKSMSPKIFSEPCPFCGSDDLGVPPQELTQVVCGSCGATGPIVTAHPYSPALTHVAARSKWNERDSSCDDGLEDLGRDE